METFVIWEGTQQFIDGNNVSCITEVEFVGEFLGKTTNPLNDSNHRGVDTSFFRDEKGRILVHVVHWSNWQNEPTYASIYVYDSIEAAAVCYRLELERAGIIPPLRITLEEFLERFPARYKTSGEDE